MFEPASLFFPAFILVLIFSLLGVWRKSFWMLIAGAVLSVPMTIYLAGLAAAPAAGHHPGAVGHSPGRVDVHRFVTTRR